MNSSATKITFAAIIFSLKISYAHNFFKTYICFCTCDWINIYSPDKIPGPPQNSTRSFPYCPLSVAYMYTLWCALTMSPRGVECFRKNRNINSNQTPVIPLCSQKLWSSSPSSYAPVVKCGRDMTSDPMAMMTPAPATHRALFLPDP